MDPMKQEWRVPNQLQRAFGVVYEIQEWIDALPISESGRYFTYAALEELISNKISHGFPGGGERYVDVRIAFADTVVRMEFVDDGEEFDPTAHPAPDVERNLAEGIDGGLGIECIRKICARMDYRREGNRNRVTLQIDVADGGAGRTVRRGMVRKTGPENCGIAAGEGIWDRGGMEWFFGICAAALAYTYAGYPAAIWVMSLWRGRPARKGRFEGGASVLIAAHNEANVLPGKVGQLLDMAGREPIREIWIGLDGCTDGTAEKVKEVVEARRREGVRPDGGEGSECPVRLAEFRERRGKAATLNELMGRAGQPVLAMLDARQRIEDGAVAALLENFADPEVGVASGELVFEEASGGAQKGAQSYWGYEKFIRRCESRFWAVPGATGAFYAIRRELCGPIPENTLVDDVLIPMRAVMGGCRCVFDAEARAYDRASEDFASEDARKRRTLAGIWQLARLEPRLFGPGNPIWFQWISHKFLRLLTPLYVAGCGAALAALAWEGGRGWRILGACAAAGALASGIAHWAGRGGRSRALGLLGGFWGVNLALARAAADAAAGRFEARWKR